MKHPDKMHAQKRPEKTLNFYFVVILESKQTSKIVE
jgi:hypothetical protein